MVLASLRAGGGTESKIRELGWFAINLLEASEAGVALCRRFSRCDGDRFQGVEIFSGSTGAPLLVASVATAECRVEAVVPVGDHTAVIGRVVALRTATGEPLIRHGMHYCLPAPVVNDRST